MKQYNHIILFISSCFILLCCLPSSVKAQVPIENLLTKYENLVKSGKLKTFNLTNEELKVAKQVSLNLGKYQKELILETEEQYTLIYTGDSPSLDSFYNEAITILKDKNYTLSKDSTIGDMKSTTYILVDNNKIKELITTLKSSNGITILVSKGSFNINPDQEEPSVKQVN